MGLCDNCALKYADCKGNKDLEKCHCDYYKKPVVMNVKELAERVAELEIENERLKSAEPTDLISRADAIEAVRYLIYDRQEKGAKPFKWWFIKQRLNALPSADRPRGDK